MSYPYYRFFPGDYLRDTRRLTLLQHGAYHLLLHEYMASGKPLRGEVDAMCRICGALSGEERTAVEFVLTEFFRRDGPLWRHKRCDIELGKLGERSAAAAESAHHRWHANAMRTHSEGNANQNQNQNQKLEVELEPKSNTLVRATRVPKAPTPSTKGTRLAENWRVPEDWMAWAIEIRPDWTPQGVVRESITFRDYWIAQPGQKGVKQNWQATWRNWIRRCNCEPAR